MRKLVKDFLVRQDYEVLEAGDGEEALKVFYENKDIAILPKVVSRKKQLIPAFMNALQ